MDKIIIHNYTKDVGYALTLAEIAYKLYVKSVEAVNECNARYELDGRKIVVHPNDKSVTITITE